MCTVSFVSTDGSKIITSNRDENVLRSAISMPIIEAIDGSKILFPKDVKAGGTWFATKESGEVSVLLNGAFVKHKLLPNYKKSRGLIHIDFIKANKPIDFFSQTSLEGIQPFTIIYYYKNLLIEFVWDGDKKHHKYLDVSKNYIWSSVTLYDNNTIFKKKQLFDQYMQQQHNNNAKEIYNFHSGKYGNIQHDFIIDRNNGIKTISITQSIINANTLQFSHFDLLTNQEFTKAFNLNNS